MIGLLLVLNDFFQDTAVELEKDGPTFSSCNLFPSRPSSY